MWPLRCDQTCSVLQTSVSGLRCLSDGLSTIYHHGLVPVTVLGGDFKRNQLPERTDAFLLTASGKHLWTNAVWPHVVISATYTSVLICPLKTTLWLLTRRESARGSLFIHFPFINQWERKCCMCTSATMQIPVTSKCLCPPTCVNPKRDKMVDWWSAHSMTVK